MALWERVKKLVGADGSATVETDRSTYEVTGSFDEVEDGDAQVLAQLRAAGCDLSKPRHVRNFLFFKEESSAQHVAKALSDKGYQCEFYPSASDPSTFIVVAERTGIVDEREVAAERFLMETLSTTYDGEYDGWEAAQG